MRTHFIVVLIVCAACAACVFSACAPDADPRGGCDEDPALCPSSVRTATDLSCDCRCVAGWSGLTPTRAFTGTVATCLPPTLNPQTAGEADKATLSQMDPAQYNQKVFKFCSEGVATFLDELMEEQQRERTRTELRGMCVGPRIRCACTTRGATQASSVCGQQCEDIECTAENCLALLRRDGTIDASSCECSRVNACGVSTPRLTEPALCTRRVSLRRRNASRTRRDAWGAQRRMNHTARAPEGRLYLSASAD